MTEKEQPASATKKRVIATPNSSAYFKPQSSDKDWLSIGKCRYEPDAMFVTGAAQNRIKTICNGCPVKKECLTDALDNKTKGVWGGMTDRERTMVLKGNSHVTSWREVIDSANRLYPREYMKAKKSGDSLPSFFDVMRDEATRIYGTGKEEKKPETKEKAVTEQPHSDQSKEVIASSKPIHTEPTVPAGFLPTEVSSTGEDPLARLARLQELKRIKSPFGNNITPRYVRDSDYFEDRDRPASRPIEGDDDLGLVDEGLLPPDAFLEELDVAGIAEEPPDELFMSKGETEGTPLVISSTQELAGEPQPRQEDSAEITERTVSEQLDQADQSESMVAPFDPRLELLRKLKGKRSPLGEVASSVPSPTPLAGEPLKRDEGKRRKKEPVGQHQQQETVQTPGAQLRREDHRTETTAKAVSEQPQQSAQQKDVTSSEPITREPTVPDGFLPLVASSTGEDPVARRDRLREQNRKRNEIQGPFGKVAPVRRNDSDYFENRSRPPSKPITGESVSLQTPADGEPRTGEEVTASPTTQETVFTATVTPTGELVVPRKNRAQSPVGSKPMWVEPSGGSAKERKRTGGKKVVTEEELVADWKAMQKIMEGKPFKEMQMKEAKAAGLLGISPTTLRRRFGGYKTVVEEMNKLCDLYPDVAPYTPPADRVLSSAFKKEKPPREYKGKQQTPDAVLDAAWPEIVKLNAGKRLTFGAIERWRRDGDLPIGSTPLKRFGTMEEIIAEMTKRTGIELKQDGKLRGKKPGFKPIPEAEIIATWKAMQKIADGEPFTEAQMKEASAADLIGVSPTTIKERYGTFAEVVLIMNDLSASHPEIAPYDPSAAQSSKRRRGRKREKRELTPRAVPENSAPRKRGRRPTPDVVLDEAWKTIVELSEGREPKFTNVAEWKREGLIPVGPAAFRRHGSDAEIIKAMTERTGIVLLKEEEGSERRFGKKPTPEKVCIASWKRMLELTKGEPVTDRKIREAKAAGLIGVSPEILERRYGRDYATRLNKLIVDHPEIEPYDPSKPQDSNTKPQKVEGRKNSGSDEQLIEASVASLGEALENEDFLVFLEEETPVNDAPTAALPSADIAEKKGVSGIKKETKQKEGRTPQESGDLPSEGGAEPSDLPKNDTPVGEQLPPLVVSAEERTTRKETLASAEIVYLPAATEAVDLFVESESESRFWFQEESDTRSAPQVIRDAAEWVFEEYNVRHDAMEQIQDAKSVEAVILSTSDNLIAVAERMQWRSDSPEFYFVCASLYTRAAKNDRSLKRYKGLMESSYQQYWKDFHIGGKGVFLPLLPYLDPRGSLSQEICTLLSQTPAPIDTIRTTIARYLNNHPELTAIIAS